MWSMFEYHRKSCPKVDKTKKFPILQVLDLNKSFRRCMVEVDTLHVKGPTWLVPMKSWDREQSGSAKHSVNILGYVEEIQHQTEPFCFYLTAFCPKMPVFPDKSAIYSNLWYLYPYSVIHGWKAVEKEHIFENTTT